MSTTPAGPLLTDRERAEVEAANASGRLPVVFVHGLWLLPSSWDTWRAHFESLGYATLAPGWPDDPETVDAARAHPEVFAGKTVGQVTDHVADVIRLLDREPVVIGHSFGGLITQKLAGLGLARAAVAVDPAPFRGVLPLPLSALRASAPVLTNPGNYNRSVSLTFDQFRYAFANAVPAEEAADLYRTYPVAAPGRPLFQAATANINPRTEASVDTRRADRGPLLVISGEKDHIVPWAIAHASYKLQLKNPSPTEIIEIPDRGHSLVVDSGWREVADASTAFLGRHGAGPDAAPPASSAT
ncbi:alpha/beta hydrolase [Terrabacter sp. 2RAF25]|uniref:alpha/beta hydrolase n=1 Tax=Terrabacter sp. 2RAF25 TaxID=3232998 RepID=UPI003F94B44F